MYHNDYAIYSQKKFFTFPKGSKFFIFLMRQQHLNMRFGNSKRYHYKNTNNTIRESRKKIFFHASFTPWPDVSKRFITKQIKGDEWKIGNEAHTQKLCESCLLFINNWIFQSISHQFNGFFSQYFVTWKKKNIAVRRKELDKGLVMDYSQCSTTRFKYVVS